MTVGTSSKHVILTIKKDKVNSSVVTLIKIIFANPIFLIFQTATNELFTKCTFFIMAVRFSP
jgi:hypothetical protein